MQPTLEKKRILVVGGSSGIGRAFAVAAASQGARLALAARSAAAVNAACESCDGAVAVVGDVTNPPDCDRIVSEASAQLGGLDAVLYTPAPGSQLLLRSTTENDWHRQLDAIVVGAANITRAALAHLRANAIMGYLSSVITAYPQYGMASYAACKSALETMIEGWRLEEPDFRFLPVVIGHTVGVGRRDEHHRDPTLRNEILRQFARRGFLHTVPMDAADLGRLLAELFALLLDHPGIAMTELVLRPASPTLLGDLPDAVTSTKPPRV